MFEPYLWSTKEPQNIKLNYFSYENTSNNAHVSHKDKAAELWNARKSLQSILVLFQIDYTRSWMVFIDHIYISRII